ncbi:MAG: hypothetical protein HGB04_00595 [Chlorobiaceae bacterium]|nr:hypothetical protein [Chlorobiaceae bacterium]
MKKSAKILALAVALFSGVGATAAHAEGFKTGVDLVSSYVWRGSEVGDSPAIQPAVTYTFDNGIAIGGWGSYGIKDNPRYKEVDLTVTLPAGPFSLSAVDYYVPTTTSARAFDFSSSSPNIVEIDVAYAAGDLSLLAAINVAGSDTKNAKYFEAGYKFYNGKDGYSAKAVAGLGSKYLYSGITDNAETKLALVNTGISVAKDRYTASYVYNPISEKSSLVFMASF